MSERRLFAPAAARNRGPILAALIPHLQTGERVLEIASGSGEHVVHFAAALPGVTFQPSDPRAEARTSIDAWVMELGLGNVRPALELDATRPWAVAEVDAVVCINMIHISPWAATTGLLREAARVLAPGGLLYLYGPYRRHGHHTAQSNEAFDQDLRRRDPAWGVRDLEQVVNEAAGAGLILTGVAPMPANNFSVFFCKKEGQGSALDPPEPAALDRNR